MGYYDNGSYSPDEDYDPLQDVCEECGEEVDLMDGDVCADCQALIDWEESVNEFGNEEEE